MSLDVLTERLERLCVTTVTSIEADRRTGRTPASARDAALVDTLQDMRALVACPAVAACHVWRMAYRDETERNISALIHGTQAAVWPEFLSFVYGVGPGGPRLGPEMPELGHSFLIVSGETTARGPADTLRARYAAAPTAVRVLCTARLPASGPLFEVRGGLGRVWTCERVDVPRTWAECIVDP